MDRVPEKCNSKYSLKQVLHRSVIYDNYSSQEGKGTELARNRLKCMLERHIRRFGMTGGIIIYDFHGYFDSIQHDIIKGIMQKNYKDPDIIGINMKIVSKNRDRIGLVLGSENSQDFAIAVPNTIDHYIKETMRADEYGRYNDDGWIIHHDFDRLEEIYQKMKELAAGLGLELNEKKCRILRFGKPFTMLKRKYSFTDTGAILQRPVRESVIRERRKLKRLYHRTCEGTVKPDTGYRSVEAWKASLKGCKCFKIRKSIENLYNDLYIRRWLSGQEDELCIIKS